MKRTMTTVALIGSLCLGLSVPVSAADTPFQDVPSSHWAMEYIETAAQNGWVSGDENHRFQPEQPVTGAEFITMVTRMLYPSEIQAGSSEGVWYHPYQTVANRHHLLSNQNANLNYKMFDALNRYEMAFILAQAMEDLQIGIDASQGTAGRIPDYDMVPEALQSSVKLVYQAGVMSGIDAAGTFAGRQNMTRAQAAVVLCQLEKLQSSDTQPTGSQGQDKEETSPLDQQPEEQVTIGQVVVEPYEGGEIIHYIPSSSIWTGERGERTYGFVVNSLSELQNTFDQVMDRYPESVTFFSTKELDFDPATLCQPYEFSHGLLPRVKGICYDYYKCVPVSLDSPYRKSAGDYYEYRMDLRYGPAGMVKMYQEGVIRALPNEENFLGSSRSADYEPLLNAVEEIKAQYGVTAASRDYDKVSAIYQYVTSNIKYDHYMASLSGMDLVNYLQTVPYPTEINFALTYKKGVCFDYSLLFKELCCAFGLECYHIGGIAGGGSHAWNIVEVDGTYYQVDATWDAGKSPEQYRYFLISDRAMQRDHRWDPAEELYQLPSCPADY